MRHSAAALLLLVLPACVSFRSEPLGESSDWPPGSGGDKTIRVLVSGEMVVNGVRQPSLPGAVTLWRQSTVGAYRESGLFAEVVTEPLETDLIAEVKFTQAEDASESLMCVSAVTVAVIPWTSSMDISAETTLKTRSGRVLGTWVATEGVNTWAQILLIFVTPFAWPPTVHEEVLRDLGRRTLLEVHASGTL